MAKFYVGVGEDEGQVIDTIAWVNKQGDEEALYLPARNKEWFFIEDEHNSIQLHTEDLFKIKKAVEKAIEMGWHKVEE